MILRLWRGRLRPGVEPELLDRLRVFVTNSSSDDGLLDLTFGFRHEAGASTFLALSVWTDFPSLLAATGGDLARSVRRIQLDDLCETTSAEAFERLPPPPPAAVELKDGRVLGLVVGRVKPNFESSVQEMVDRSSGAAIKAGALAAHTGRRLAGSATEIAVVVVWPDRETLLRFVRSRDVGALDPRFTAQLTEWRFETYNGLAPERLLVPSSGPAVLVADDEGRYLEATPGVERVLGIPGELLMGRSVVDLVSEQPPDGDLWRRFREDGEQEGEIELRRPDGKAVRARYRAAANTPAPGMHASVLFLPDEAPDSRSVAEIVGEALALETSSAPG